MKREGKGEGREREKMSLQKSRRDLVNGFKRENQNPLVRLRGWGCKPETKAAQPEQRQTNRRSN